ncbi:MAG: ShlB/FhaC/HecB family hemolysin secretion/activation protein [Planctomycetota bacterium]|jgi:hemolysin activation/secretion protein
MGSKKKALGIVVVLMVVCMFFADSASARFLFFGEKLTPEQRLERYEEIEAQKQAAEREKREAREAARAQKEEQARLKQFNAEAQKQAKEEIAQAKIERNEKLAAVKAKEKEQAVAIRSESAGIKLALKDSKSQANAEYKQSVAGASAEEKEFLAAEHKDELAGLDTQYKQDMAALNERQQYEKAQNAMDKEQIEQEYQGQVVKINMAMKRKIGDALIETLDLPVDTSATYNVTDLQISGNTLITTPELLTEMPLVYNASNLPLTEAPGLLLFDLRPIHDVIIDPGQTHEVSVRTIQGLTQYFLSVYQQQNWDGIYVYVPQESIVEDQLVDEILQIEVLEAPISSITVNSYEPNQVPATEPYLKSSTILKWSPVKVGEVADQKALNDFVNLLNLNPDRYVSANPWHWFVQVDNAGTKDRQWNPRIGLINTNLLGFDDTLTVVYQNAWDKTIDEEYAIYGSYDFPVVIPRLRLNLYGGYSQYNTTPESGPTDYIGNGSFGGGILKYNLFQHEGWFFDARGIVEYTKSKVKTTNPIFSPSTDSEVEFTMWGVGPQIHRSDDIRQTTIGYTHWKSMGGGSDGQEFAQARTGSDTLFTIYDFHANHSQFLDVNNVTRLSGTFRWVGSDERLVPAKMTSFGGMYTVRGYDEYEVVADGGILASLQYEYDIIQYLNTQEGVKLQDEETGKRPLIRRLAPLGFIDYGRSAIRHPRPGLGEDRHVEMISVGTGVILELGDNFSGAVYYGYPLENTDDTRTGKGRVSTSLLVRW